jgi:hypothetical protein
VRKIGVWLVVGAGVAVPCAAWAQPQADAELAAVPQKETYPRPWSIEGATPARPRPKPTAEEPEDPPLSTEELRKQLPDIELRDEPHHSKLGVYLGILFPFQYFAAGLSSDAYVTPRWRINALATAGVSPAWHGKSKFSPYGELSVGFAIKRWHTTAVVDLPQRQQLFTKLVPEAERPTYPAELPSSHSIELELGYMVGLIPLYRCSANCDAEDLGARTVEDETPWLVSALAGIRYYYFRWARSKTARFRSTMRFQATADLITRTLLNQPAADLQNYQGQTISRSPVGGRLTLQVPLHRCVAAACFGINMTGGYFPSPGTPIVAMSVIVY